MDYTIDISDQIQGHMDDQPYEITCAVCGDSLKIKKKIDLDFDLFIEVEPCEKCMEEARGEAKEE